MPANIGLYNVLNILKSVAFTADAKFKEDGQDKVRYHHLDAAVALAVLDYLKAGKNPTFLFGEQPPEVIAQLMSFLESKAKDIESASDDRTLNAAVFGGPAFKLIDAYFPIEYIDEKSSSFRGHVVINSSFGDEIKEGTLVNVALRLDEESKGSVTASAKAAIESSLQFKDATIGRLTGTKDLEERHVTLGARLPYTKALGELVAKINAEGGLMGKTVGKLKVVVPPDIRAQFSAVSMVDDETIRTIQPLQREITLAAGAEGNKLPPLHVTQANKFVEIDHEKLAVFERLTSIAEKLKSYGLNLPSTVTPIASDAMISGGAGSVSSLGIFGGAGDSVAPVMPEGVSIKMRT